LQCYGLTPRIHIAMPNDKWNSQTQPDKSNTHTNTRSTPIHPHSHVHPHPDTCNCAHTSIHVTHCRDVRGDVARLLTNRRRRRLRRRIITLKKLTHTHTMKRLLGSLLRGSSGPEEATAWRARDSNSSSNSSSSRRAVRVARSRSLSSCAQSHERNH